MEFFSTSFFFFIDNITIFFFFNVIFTVIIIIDILFNIRQDIILILFQTERMIICKSDVINFITFFFFIDIIAIFFFNVIINFTDFSFNCCTSIAVLLELVRSEIIPITFL